MNAAAQPAQRLSGGGVVAVVGFGAATVGLALATDGSLVATAAPVLVGGLVALCWTLPLRTSLLALIYLALATESQGDASGRWTSPAYALGVLLHSNLNRLVPVGALKFTGLDLLGVFLVVLVIARRSQGSRVDGGGFVPLARPVAVWSLGALGSIAVLAAWGLAHGGDANQIYWQVHQFAFVPILTFLCAAAFRGPRDHRALAATYIAAACTKAAMGIWVGLTIRAANGLPVASVTSHGDSILFATAVAMMLALLAERTDVRSVKLCALVLPVLFAAMLYNHRRLVWVELAGVLLTFYLVSPWTNLKRALTRLAILSIPAIAIYLAAGWTSGAGIFKPVQTIRSILVSKSDRSTEERDVENYNLLNTLRQNPVLGLGFGHKYVEEVKGDDISAYFAQYRYVPHNSLLGVWAFAGVAGFTGLWMMLAIGVFLSARAYRRASLPIDRAAALTVIGVVAIYMLQCYGDMGFVSWAGTFTLGPALAMSGKLAVATGAWPAPARRGVQGSAALAAGGAA